MGYSKFDDFLNCLKGAQRIIVQAHDFPSHDALASAFAFACLLKNKGFKPFISYRGYINRQTLHTLIDSLNIPTVATDKLELIASDKVIMIGGRITESHRMNFPELDVAVIDHHDIKAPDFVCYADIRPEFSTTASMMVEYYNHCDIKFTPRIASALLVGLTLDTDKFTKKITVADAKALLQLQQHADMSLVNLICKNKIEFEELEYFNAMLNSMKREKNCVFAILPEDCSHRMLGILGDLLLSADEIELVILSVRNEGNIYISLRSECIKNDVNHIITTALNEPGIGFGGGLPEHAGGIINDMYQLAEDLDYVHDLLRPHLILS